MEPICFFAGGQQQPQVGDERIPVAWLEGEVLDEYMKLLEEEEAVGDDERLPVAWLEGEVPDEYMKFLEEPAAVGDESLPVAWLEGDVLDEYMEFLEEEVAVGDERLPVAWLEGEVLDEYMKFLEEPAAVGDELLPVAWLEGEVLDEYMKFLEEPAAVGDECLPAAWLEGEVLDEYMKFLEEPAAVGDERLPAAWLEGEVLGEYMQFLEEAAPPPTKTTRPVVEVEWMEGEAFEEFLRFLAEAQEKAGGSDRREECAREAQDSNVDDEFLSVDGGAGFIDDAYGRLLMEALDQDSDDDGDFPMDGNGGGDEVPVIDGELRFAEEGFDQAPEDGVVGEDGGSSLMDEDDEEIEMLMPHILNLPAVRERAAAVQPETAPPRPRQGGGWMQFAG